MADADRALDDAGLDASWRPVVEAFRGSAAGQRLAARLAARRAAGATVYPPEPLRALALTPLAAVRAVILGQDPYHGPGQAEGLAFSVPAGVRPPPSLRNIFAELQRDLGQPPPASGSLVAWARRGVLLLNTSLTVEDGQPGSHAKFGWEVLTDSLIEAVARQPQPVAFLLWGTHAQAKAAVVAAGGGPHRIWQANHPSPLSARRPPVPFIGCGHFSAAARFLADAGRPLDWALAAPGPRV
ncbi:uracil-DNA glycosylase [Methylibium sp. Pch-M]|uniref:uracil-DNA glycosylase n=1 Tax=Methylibium sp. Pch-M TaxID=2082386 RepID=UPI001012801F|nr:uracil-DNA glycosylase [Methylibium sp. Pch-M]QAZ39227.1 uracil-DNA glycosylase [Methylibium sp. Pch-M]